MCARVPVQALMLGFLKITSSFVFQAKLTFKYVLPFLCHFLLFDEENVEVFVVCSSQTLLHHGPAPLFT